MGSSYSVPVFKRTLAVFVLRRGIGLACRYRLINMSSFRKLKDFDEKPDKCCMPKNEENIYPRIEILDSASHFDPKSGGTFSNQIVGTIRKISINGIQIATFRKIQSEYVILRFIELENNKTEIEGRVISCSIQETGTFSIGIDFQGTNDEKIKFVRKISAIMPLIYQPVLVDNPGNHKDSA